MERHQSPYARFVGTSDLILRDELAIDRTLLANERTLLAYLRSGVAMLLAGMTFIHFAQHQWYTVLGILCLPGGIAAMIFGGRRYRAMDGQIQALRTIDRERPAAAGNGPGRAD